MKARAMHRIVLPVAEATVRLRSIRQIALGRILEGIEA